uniref:Uncharacterized protein n=2 Tax=viral metagenome TaxID=1070528 RepID=A0A6M3KB45_9ZZZZ
MGWLSDFYKSLGDSTEPSVYQPYIPPEYERQEEVSGARKEIGESTRDVTEALYQLTKAQTDAAPIRANLPEYTKSGSINRQLEGASGEVIRDTLKKARGSKSGADGLTIAEQLGTLESLGLSFDTKGAKTGEEETKVSETLGSFRDLLKVRKQEWEDYVSEFTKRKTAHEQLPGNLDALYDTYISSLGSARKALDVLKEFSDPFVVPAKTKPINEMHFGKGTIGGIARKNAMKRTVNGQYTIEPEQKFTDVYSMVPGTEITKFEQLLSQTEAKPKIPTFPKMERTPFDVI